jgi:hypothetical protein
MTTFFVIMFIAWAVVILVVIGATYLATRNYYDPPTDKKP